MTSVTVPVSYSMQLYDVDGKECLVILAPLYCIVCSKVITCDVQRCEWHRWSYGRKGRYIRCRCTVWQGLLLFATFFLLLHSFYAFTRPDSQMAARCFQPNSSFVRPFFLLSWLSVCNAPSDICQSYYQTSWGLLCLDHGVVHVQIHMHINQHTIFAFIHLMSVYKSTYIILSTLYTCNWSIVLCQISATLSSCREVCNDVVGHVHMLRAVLFWQFHIDRCTCLPIILLKLCSQVRYDFATSSLQHATTFYEESKKI